MKAYILSLFNGINRRTTLLLLILSAVLISTAFLIGVSDNITAIIVLISGILLLVAAFIHIWKKIKSYLLFALVSALAFPLFVVLHNVFSGLADLISGKLWLVGILNFLDAFTFVLAVIICPASVVAGLLGALILFIKEKRAESGNSAG